MSDALTVKNFASLLSEADRPEQPSQDSGAAEIEATEEGLQDAATEPEAEATAETEGEEGQTEQPETDSDRVIKWQTASGEAIEATEDELKAGYLRQKDYTQKAQAVAEERKQAQAAFVQQTQIVQALAAEIGEFQAVQGELAKYQNVDWSALEESDPVSAMRYWRHFQQLKERAGQAEQKVRQARGLIEQQQERATVEGIQAAEKRLVENVKGVNRDEVVRTFSTLQKMGADARVIDSIRSNPALAEMAIYANRWLELQDKKPQVANQVKKLPPATTKARPAQVQTKGEQVVKAIQSKRTFGADEFARLLKATR